MSNKVETNHSMSSSKVESNHKLMESNYNVLCDLYATIPVITRFRVPTSSKDTKKAKSSSSRVVLDETGPHHPKSLYHELVFKNFSL